MKRNVLCGILAVWVIFTVTREFLPYDFTWYKSSHTTHSNVSFSTHSSTISGFASGSAIDLDSGESWWLMPVDFQDYDPSMQKANQIDLHLVVDPDLGWTSWIPLVKIFSIGENASFHWQAEVKANGKTIRISGHGSFFVKGNCSIYGVCSHKHAYEGLRSHMEDKALRTIADKIEDQFTALTSGE